MYRIGNVLFLKGKRNVSNRIEKQIFIKNETN